MLQFGTKNSRRAWQLGNFKPKPLLEGREFFYPRAQMRNNYGEMFFAGYGYSNQHQNSPPSPTRASIWGSIHSPFKNCFANNHCYVWMTPKHRMTHHSVFVFNHLSQTRYKRPNDSIIRERLLFPVFIQWNSVYVDLLYGLCKI
ncbi:hypothetical protein WN51_12023 [Melipona quadrifasciata]|uniref:Uncharacterized protein n=1 Tax=Melipona quadrifasciata TaxID=166423 RepID=A0A0M9A3I1_9HYME|nr:hypothetical protein WN51_12023 [Melipona quadrifasciata]